MRKMILTLAVVLLVAPAWADVEITLTREDLVITIGYVVTGETELVRAFALDIVATDGNIVAIDDYSRGDDTGGYGIFPGSFAGNITVNTTTGDVDNWDGNPNPYTPVAPAGDPDALGDIPGPAITIEMGSLYTTAGPGDTGVLCTITVEATVTEVCVTGNAIRGNVVLEDASEAALNPAQVCIPGPGANSDCFPSSAPYAAQYLRWVALGKPACWCGSAYWTSGNQCYGDGAGDTHSRGYIVYTTDLTKLSDAWKKVVNGDGSLPPGLDPCADYMHDVHSRGYVVYTTDLGVLSTNWKKTSLLGNCPLTDAGNAAR